MSDMRETLMGIIARDVMDVEASADAIIDALPDMVKPLEWDGPNCGIWDAGKRFNGDCVAYTVFLDLGKNEAYTTYFGNKRLGVFENLEAAKAACQSHFGSQSVSAFGVTL